MKLIKKITTNHFSIGLLLLAMLGGVSINYLKQSENQIILYEEENEEVSIASTELNMDTVINIVKEVYAEITVLPIGSDKTKHCNWLENYTTKIAEKLENKYGKKEKLFAIVGYTKKKEIEYIQYYKKECKLLPATQVSEEVKNKLDKVIACSSPINRNRFKPKGYRNCISKFFPKEKETMSLIEIWHNTYRER